MANFKSPYFSGSVKEFWGRWHISLSTWFRDYVYIPLGGNRVGRVKHSINVMVTFLASGLWHGANWTFVIWGGVHGLAQVLEHAMALGAKPKSVGILWWIKVLAVFLFMAFTWIFFVSNTTGDAFYVIGHALEGISSPVLYLHNGFSNIGLDKMNLLFLLMSLLLLILYDYASLNQDVIHSVSSKRTIVRWGIYVLFIVWIIMNIPVARSTEFIYFQF